MPAPPTPVKLRTDRVLMSLPLGYFPLTALAVGVSLKRGILRPHSHSRTAQPSPSHAMVVSASDAHQP